MKIILGVTFVVSMLDCAICRASDEGWTALFDGTTLNGWHNPYDRGEAKVVDGEIHLTSNEKFLLVTDATYSNFILEAEVKVPEGKANSGFMFRAQVKPNKVWGYQAEVDTTDRAWSGGLFDEARRQWLHPFSQIRLNIKLADDSIEY